MKYWIHLIIIILIGALAGRWMPWWSIAIIAIFSSHFLKHSFGLAAMFGFLAGFLLWAGLTFYRDVENQHILSARMGELFGGINSTLLIVITGVVGGIIVALGSMVGSSFNEILAHKKQTT